MFGWETAKILDELEIEVSKLRDSIHTLSSITNEKEDKIEELEKRITAIEEKVDPSGR